MLGIDQRTTIIHGGNRLVFVVQLINVSDVRVSGFTIKGGRAPEDFVSGGAGILVNFPGGSIRLRDNILTENDIGIYILNGYLRSGPDIESNFIHHNKTVAIAGLGNGVVTNNIITDNGSGISAGDSIVAQIINNTIVKNRGYGISVFNVFVISIINNIIVQNEGFGINVDSGNNPSTKRPLVVSNLFFRNTLGNFSDIDPPIGNNATLMTAAEINSVPGNTGNLVADPRFVSLAGSVHLTPDSPAIDAGILPGLLLTDFDGDPRPLDGTGDGLAAIDIGADEFIETVFVDEVALSRLTLQFEHGCVIKDNGTLWCWGEAASGRLGNGTTRPPQLTPIPVPLTEVRQVDTGIHQTCAVQVDGTAWCWGDGSQYQLGYGDIIGQLWPRQVVGLTEVVEIATNDGFSCARKRDGTAWCWGAGGDGQLGYGGRSTQRRPVPVSQATGLTFLTQLAVSDRHTCAVHLDGTAWCWGANNSGQLGDGTTARRTLPTPVGGLPAVQQVVAGAHHSCALTTAGTVWCWGDNRRGELGRALADRQPQTPGPVTGLANVTFLSAQVWHTCAVTGDGTVWCWGRNATGQLGDGTTTDRQLPVQVVGLTDVAQVSAGYYASCALKHDGTAWCWGAGGSGRLGHGSTQGSLTPVQVHNIP